MYLTMKVKMDMENLEKLIKEQQERLKELARKVVSDMYVPQHIIHNWKTDETIVIWKNGDKTKVKLREGEIDHLPIALGPDFLHALFHAVAHADPLLITQIFMGFVPTVIGVAVVVIGSGEITLPHELIADREVHVVRFGVVNGFDSVRRDHANQV